MKPTIATTTLHTARKRPNATVLWAGLLAAAMVFMTGCETAQQAGDDDVTTPAGKVAVASVDEIKGLLLIDQVVAKQVDINKVTIIKTIRPEVKAMLDEIAKASADASREVQAMIKAQGPRAQNVALDMPKLEDKAREGIESISTREIVFGSGNELEFRLLSSQLQSSRYVSQLALAASNDTHGTNREKLRQISDQFGKIYNQVFGIMIKAYRP